MITEKYSQYTQETDPKFTNQAPTKHVQIY